MSNNTSQHNSKELSVPYCICNIQSIKKQATDTTQLFNDNQNYANFTLGAVLQANTNL